MLSRINKNLFSWGIAAIILIAGCSPSSYTERYNKPRVKEEKQRDNSTRFTSKDDKEKAAEAETKTVTNYNNVPPVYNSEFDEPPVEEYPVDTKEFISNYNKLKGLGVSLTPREKVLFEIVKYLETPYQYGGETLTGIDCSSFTQQVFKNSLNHNLPRTASEQFLIGSNIFSEAQLKFGDLIFFDTQKIKYPGHVGIYLGDNLFAHSSSSQGVTVSSLQSSYYTDRYVGAKRLQNIFGD
ncbi:MAG: C40 family peptidase [Ignavibacteriae bacterium]|jgi:cell wall-associated NlpC family hydrolase|nr:NlpC/P60 family protein [Ignavibacteriota bacterium]NOG97607.1 C40 family peptidase [Ignavibacteriota bacterium]